MSCEQFIQAIVYS